MAWTISQQPGKSDFWRPLPGPFRSVVLDSFSFAPRITFDPGWSSGFNFSMELQVIKSKLLSQLKIHLHQSLYVVWTGWINLLVGPLFPKWFLANWKGGYSHSEMVLVEPKCHPYVPSSAFWALSMQQFLLEQQLQMLTQKVWRKEFVLQASLIPREYRHFRCFKQAEGNIWWR